ncbi:TIGR04283 family arsenosugar biosynthesis glycosyltransferase [Desulfohalovibrio reitneri]|uniref:TIGR04283 family arsenosugar biosynthesis glycosyltransferase n=1 Tax=Desulfohalovibrio reitneri TaxID=1307759 RepID=UPI0004A6E179|nr:TIGR04283 family arsenosugar biosynthesis glycosyltransferase [Desulfohalovibrio reitneri]
MPPRFSVVIPVLGEAETIAGAVRHLRETALGHDVEVVVADGDPDGSTLEAVDDPEVVCVLARKGRARQMNAGARAASGEVLAFLHADTVLPRGAFEVMERVLEGNGAGAFDLAIDSPRPALRLIAWMANRRSRATRMPYGDQCLFLRRRLFEDMDGFADIPLMEDVEFCRRLKRRGTRMELAPQRVLTSPRRWEKQGVAYGTLRNWTLVSLYFMGVPPQKLVRWY